MNDVGLVVSFGSSIDNTGVTAGHVLYHAIAKATDDGTYLQDYWTKRSLSGNYSPVEEKLNSSMSELIEAYKLLSE